MAGRSRDKTKTFAFLLPLFGLFLLMPPAALAFGLPGMFQGVPLIVVYIFTVWGGMIIGAAWLAGRLSRPSDGRPSSVADQDRAG